MNSKNLGLRLRLGLLVKRIQEVDVELESSWGELKKHTVRMPKHAKATEQRKVPFNGWNSWFSLDWQHYPCVQKPGDLTFSDWMTQTRHFIQKALCRSLLTLSQDGPFLPCTRAFLCSFHGALGLFLCVFCFLHLTSFDQDIITIYQDQKCLIREFRSFFLISMSFRHGGMGLGTYIQRTQRNLVSRGQKLWLSLQSSKSMLLFAIHKTT